MALTADSKTDLRMGPYGPNLDGKGNGGTLDLTYSVEIEAFPEQFGRESAKYSAYDEKFPANCVSC